MMEYKARICMRCAQEFEVQYASQVCCGEDCRKKRRQELKNLRAVVYRRQAKKQLVELRERAAQAEGRLETMDMLYGELREKHYRLDAQNQKLRAALARVVRIRRHLNTRINAFLDASGGEKQTLVPRKTATKKTVREPSVVPHEEMDAILRGEAGVPPKKALYNKLRAAAKAPINSEMQVCERMSCAALRLPCGEREECFTPRCERVPAGVEWRG